MLIILSLIYNEIILMLFSRTADVQPVLMYSAAFSASIGAFFYALCQLILSFSTKSQHTGQPVSSSVHSSLDDTRCTRSAVAAEQASSLTSERDPAAVSVFSHSPAQFLISVPVFVIIALYFTTESVVRSIFSMYFSPSALFSGAGNVARQYTDELLSGIAIGAVRFLIFSVPALLCLSAYLIRRTHVITFLKKPAGHKERGQAGEVCPVFSGDPNGGACRASLKNPADGRWSVPLKKADVGACGALFKAAVLLLFSFILHFAASEAVLSGSSAPVYTSQYNFNNAVEQFGLCEATFLHFHYSVTGIPADSFDELSSVGEDGLAKFYHSEEVQDTLQDPELPAGIFHHAEDDSAGSVFASLTGISNEDRQASGTFSASASGFVFSSAGSSGADLETSLDAFSESAAADAATDGSGSESVRIPGSDQQSGAEFLQGSEYAGESDAESLQGSESAREPEPENEPVLVTEPVSEPEPVPKFNVMDINFPHESASKQVSQLSDYLETLAPSEKNRYTGIFSGKNLIMICAESYCDAFISPELTPTIWRLTHNGIYFSDYYQPSWGGSTSTGELSMLLGLDSNSGADAMIKIAGNNHYFSMGNQLQRHGYFSLAFHNGSHTFYSRNLTHEGLGYDAFFASGKHLDAFCGHSYPTDTEMIEGTLPAYVSHQPFSVYYMTVSGHAAYEKNSLYVRKYYDTVNAAVGDDYYEKTKYYICYQMELESALKALVDGLEEAGIADDTVIVMTGDHYPYGLGNGQTWHNDRDYINDLIKCSDALYWNEDKSGLVIWSGCLEHELKDMACEISEPTMSLDILPTVSNLFGVEFDSRLLPGRDVFAETEPLVFWNNLSWITREGKYDTRKHVYYPDEDTVISEEDQEEYIKTVNAIVNGRILMCTSIMNTDYYALLFGPDEVKADPDAVWAQLKTELEAREAEPEEQP